MTEFAETAENLTFLPVPYDNLQLSSDAARRLHAGTPEDPLVAKYLLAARADNTRRAYAADLTHFSTWGGAIPSTPEEIARYLAEHAELLKPATLARRLAALAAIHLDGGVTDPTKHLLVRRVMHGIGRYHGSTPRRVKPLMIGDLARIASCLGNSLEDLRDRAILLVGFFGALRRSELAALDCENIQSTATGVVARISRSKTDPHAKGRHVHLAGRQDGVCPVCAIAAWRAVAGSLEGPLFCRLERHGPGARVTGADIARIVKNRTAQAELDPEAFSGHSLRAGFATSAALAGFDALAIASQTGHRSGRTLATYVRPAGLSLPNMVETA